MLQNTTNVSARIIIVAYNSADCLSDCVDALEKQTQGNFEVVIVNNDCPQNSTKELMPLKSNFTILEAGDNLGFAAGCNLGAQGAQAKWIITLNPDTKVREDWFEELNRAWQSSPSTECWGCVQIMDQDRSKLDGFGDVFSIFGIAWRGGYNQSVELAQPHNVNVFGPCGAVGVYRRAIFEKLGGFDATYFCYLEDVDLALRFNLFGARTKIASNAIVYHRGGASSAANFHFPIYQTSRNNVYLVLKNLPFPLLLFTVPNYLILQFWIIIRNINDGHTSARISGFHAGLKLIPKALRERKNRQYQPKVLRRLWPMLSKSYFHLKGQKIYFFEKC